MAYYTVSPEKACQHETVEISLDNLYIPGVEESFNIETELEVGDVMHNGDLIDGGEVAAKSTMFNFLNEYEGEQEELGIFLGYAENDWSYQEMWHESNYSRTEINQANKTLEEYGMIEMDFGDVNLTAKGEDVYRAFDILSEDQEILHET